jgi:hypothetical protein
MLTALGMYSESFEKPFLECTSEFYATEGVKYMQQSDIPDYLKHVEVRMDRFPYVLHVICSCRTSQAHHLTDNMHLSCAVEVTRRT